MKFDNASQMLEYLRKSLDVLVKDPDGGGKLNVLGMVCKHSGLNPSTVYKFQSGKQQNMNANNMDKLLIAVRKVKQELAA